ncbi:hypothetical protein MMC24_002516 [Lignoscripta atroalba]|nr:hypothetical protein [Lignoscripta atroalba]
MRIPYFSSKPSRWRSPKVLLILFACEVPFTIAALALFGIADPNLYRTLLWQEGANHGWNSDPDSILYAYANHKPIDVPLPWRQFVTTFNVIISVLSLFILLIKSVLYIMHLFPPLVSALIHAALIALYAVSARNQAGPDMNDAEHPAKIPWYLTKSCGPPVSRRLHGYCQQAKGAFAVTICMCVLFFVYFIISLISLIRPPSSSSSTSFLSKKHAPSDLESPSSPSPQPETQRWELSALPPSPGPSSSSFSRRQTDGGAGNGMMSPMTPRTLAFHTLDGNVGSVGKKHGIGRGRNDGNRKSSSSSGNNNNNNGQNRKSNRELPLRHHIAMGDETYKGKGEK